MSQIPVNNISVGISDPASIQIDMDALVRDSMIKLYGIKDSSGKPMDKYDSAYFDLQKQGLNIDPSTPGVASLIQTFATYEIDVLSFLFQNILYLISPIQTALQLPELLTNPVKLANKVGSIVSDITKLIKSITQLLTDTEKWFINTLFTPIQSLNVPIPPLSISLLGIKIPIPQIDNDDTFSKPAFLEKLDAKISDRIDLINSGNTQFIKPGMVVADLLVVMEALIVASTLIKDSNNNDKTGLSQSLLGVINTSIPNLLLQYITIIEDLYTYAINIHNDEMKKQELVLNTLNKQIHLTVSGSTVLSMNNTAIFTLKNRINDLQQLKSELDNYKKNININYDVNTYNIIKEIPFGILDIVGDEENQTASVIAKYNLNSLATFKKGITTINNDIEANYVFVDADLKQLSVIDGNLTDDYNSQNSISNLSGSTNQSGSTTKSNDDKLASLLPLLAGLSPSSAWKKQIEQTVIGIITAPITMIINLIKELLEAVLEFLKELPTPSFKLIKKFFTDITGLPNLEKLTKTFKGLILGFSTTISPNDPVIDKVMTFIPELAFTVLEDFIKSILNPLPI